MVMGLEGTKKFLSSHPKLKLEVYLLYDLTNGKIGKFKSKGMKKYFKD
jgi:hypothetical protein